MNSNRAKLSKSILEMKFMKRTKEKVEKQQFKEEGEEYFGNEVTQRMKKNSDTFIIEPSYVFCEKLTDGRVSFRGMNPEIEKLMEEEKSEERILLEKKEEKDVSDEQMVQHFKGLQKKLKSGQKFDRKFQNHYNDGGSAPKRPKFLKPQD